MKNLSCQTAALILSACAFGALLDRVWVNTFVPTVAAQESGRAGAPAAPKPMTSAEMQAEIERLKTLVPSYSHPMQDVAINWASLWFAAQKKNWPLARYFYNENFRGPNDLVIDQTGGIYFTDPWGSSVLNPRVRGAR